MGENTNKIFNLVEITVKEYGTCIISEIHKKWAILMSEYREGNKELAEVCAEFEQFLNEYTP